MRWVSSWRRARRRPRRSLRPRSDPLVASPQGARVDRATNPDTVELLMAAMEAVPPRSDPGEDLVTRGVKGISRLRSRTPGSLPPLLRDAYATGDLERRGDRDPVCRVRPAHRTRRASTAGGPPRCPRYRGSDVALGCPMYRAGAPRDLRTDPAKRGARLWGDALQAFVRGMGPEAGTAINRAARSR